MGLISDIADIKRDIKGVKPPEMGREATGGNLVLAETLGIITASGGGFIYLGKTSYPSPSSLKSAYYKGALALTASDTESGALYPVKGGVNRLRLGAAIFWAESYADTDTYKVLAYASDSEGFLVVAVPASGSGPGGESKTLSVVTGARLVKYTGVPDGIYLDVTTQTIRYLEPYE